MRSAPGEQPGQPAEQARFFRMGMPGGAGRHCHLPRRPVAGIATGFAGTALTRRTTLAARRTAAFGRSRCVLTLRFDHGSIAITVAIATTTTPAWLARAFRARRSVSCWSRPRGMHGYGDR